MFRAILECSQSEAFEFAGEKATNERPVRTATVLTALDTEQIG